MLGEPPVIVWLRRDLRLHDHAAFSAACRSGRPVLAVFIHDQIVADLGAAPRLRLERALRKMRATLAANGNRLILRRGDALGVLQDLIAETGAQHVFWSRDFAPNAIARDRQVKFSLRQAGIEARSFRGMLLFEPWNVRKRGASHSSDHYKVFTPFWHAVRNCPVPPPRPAVTAMRRPTRWPVSDDLDDWQLSAGMKRGAQVVTSHVEAGEAAALARLNLFLQNEIQNYAEGRDFLAAQSNARMSDFLAWGEISPARIWHAAKNALAQGGSGPEAFMRQLAWREFAWNLMFHAPTMAEQNWRAGWEDFAWRRDETRPEVIAWKQGRTGVDVVDAAMRELYVTGRMHNRARMITASYLTKHLLADWRIGLRWFADCLVDWDPAANAMGWQWVAGCGPDAAPFFRVFNPDTQAAKFDPDGAYRRRWLSPDSGFYDAIPRSWGMAPGDPRPAPALSLAQGRTRALQAYQALRAAQG